MNLIEIKNNLAKLSYVEEEQPILGRFIVFVNQDKSYVGQLVNLKSDMTHSYAIAKLIFTFNSEGIVEDYDGSIPSMASMIGNLPASELLNLLTIETPIKIGKLAQIPDMLSLDISIFERNLTIFTEKDSNEKTFISNCIRQLFQMKEKSVVVDNSNMFEDYPKIRLGVDYKLPLNSEMIDYLFEHELSQVDVTTKSTIQDIFYAVQQYIDSLDFKFIPIDNFVDVVTNQYKELQMPELALLKNKLLKYRDAKVFANTKDEVLAFKAKLTEKNCCIVDIKDIEESLQKEILSILHSTLETFDKYVYLFVPLTDDNSDKKLLKKFINHNHVFTTMLTSSEYKYAKELRQYAQNIIQFAPQRIHDDFASYNTFLNKLNPDECIVYGKLTQGIPFIVEMSTIKTDLTQDDVLGDRYQFIPVVEETQLVKIDDYGNQIPVSLPSQTVNYTTEQVDINTSDEQTITPLKIEVSNINKTTANFESDNIVAPQATDELSTSDIIEQEQEQEQEIDQTSNNTIIEPISNILESDDFQDSEIHEDSELEEISNDESQAEKENQNLTEEDLDFLDELEMEDDENSEEDNEEEEVVGFPDEIEDEIAPEMVPIYPADDNKTDNGEITFNQGDTVNHPRYGNGVVEKIIKYGNKTLCSISFDNVGRRLLDPSISELNKI